MLAFAIAALLSSSPSPSELDKPAIGIRVATTDEFKKAAGKNPDVAIPKRKGLVVIAVTPYSPTEKSGIKETDLILSANGKPTHNSDDISKLVASSKRGDIITFSVSSIVSGSKNINWAPARKVEVTVATAGLNCIAAMEDSANNVNGNIFYRHRDGLKVDSGTASFELYFQATMGSAHNLRIRARYFGDDWIFADRFSVGSGDKASSAEIAGVDWSREIKGNGDVTETADIPATKEFVNAVLAGIEKQRLSFSAQGDRKAAAVDFDERKIWSLKQTIDAYLAMGGKLP